MALSVAAHVVVQKIVDQLPLYRCAKFFALLGVNLPESTLGHIYTSVANLLLPLYEAHRHRKDLRKTERWRLQKTVVKNHYLYC